MVISPRANNDVAGEVHHVIGVDFELIGTHLQVAEWPGGKSEVV